LKSYPTYDKIFDRCKYSINDKKLQSSEKEAGIPEERTGIQKKQVEL